MVIVISFSAAINGDTHYNINDKLLALLYTSAKGLSRIDNVELLYGVWSDDDKDESDNDDGDDSELDDRDETSMKRRFVDVDDDERLSIQTTGDKQRRANN